MKDLCDSNSLTLLTKALLDLSMRCKYDRIASDLSGGKSGCDEVDGMALTDVEVIPGVGCVYDSPILVSLGTCLCVSSRALADALTLVCGFTMGVLFLVLVMVLSHAYK